MKLNKWFLLLVCLYSNLPLFSQEINVSVLFGPFANDTLLSSDPRLKEIPTKTFTADDVLNRTIKWNHPYHPDITPQTNGFDFSKVGKTPAKGIHPRIFTAPADFTDIKVRLETTKMGQQLSKLAEAELGNMRKGGGKSGKFYQLLLTGTNLVDPKAELPKEMANLLSIQGLLAQLNHDKALTAKTGTIAANYLKIVLNQIAKKEPILGREKMVKEEIFSGASLAKLFDFTAAGMTSSDKKIITDLFAKNTNGKYSVGMELPPHWRRWNHIPASGQYGLTMLAIENEKGYDKRIYACATDVAEDYLTYAFSSDGMSSEGLTYTFGPFESELLFMTAMLRREGKNLFANPHFRAIPDWLIYTLSPNPECLWSSHGDTGSTSKISWTMMMVMKYFFPEDARIDYLFANALYKEELKLPDVSAFVFCNDPSKTASAYNGIPPVKMPLTYFSPTRGSFITRDHWDKNGVMFQWSLVMNQGSQNPL